MLLCLNSANSKAKPHKLKLMLLEMHFLWGVITLLGL
jgi:hypothetical protein